MIAPKILFVMLEFKAWTDASHYSYPSNWGFVDGMRANDAEVVILPHLYGNKCGSPSSWLTYVRDVFAGQQFDQVWFEAVHNVYSDDFLEWLSDIAPIRVGLVGESIEFDPGELTNNPTGVQIRIENRNRNFPLATHFLCVDEIDVTRFNAEGRQAMWWSSCKMPRRFISDQEFVPASPVALFYGALYGDRRAWLENPALQGILVRPETSAEMNTNLPTKYETLIRMGDDYLCSPGIKTFESLNTLLEALNDTRSEAYSIWLKGLQAGVANVNLPQFARAYASRIIEAMAINRPAISWKIPNRPMTELLFVNGEEILLYSRDNPLELAEHIKHVIEDRDFARSIATKARAKLLKYHTCEGSVADALNWIQTGVQPRYYD